MPVKKKYGKIIHFIYNNSVATSFVFAVGNKHRTYYQLETNTLFSTLEYQIQLSGRLNYVHSPTLEYKNILCGRLIFQSVLAAENIFRKNNNRTVSKNSRNKKHFYKS